MTILGAATQLFADEGLNAPTSRIAKKAGVAEGTIFTYFASKDELMNQLYLELKGKLRSTLISIPQSAKLREQLWQAWKTYVTWGVANPQEHQVLAKLGLSARINQATRAEASRDFVNLSHLLEQAVAKGALRNQPIEFAASMMSALGDVTMNSMRNNPEQAESLCADGFTAFWSAITKA